MKKVLCLIILSSFLSTTFSQNVAAIKKELETTQDPFGYVKYVLKKKFTIDTITVMTTSNFLGIADSIAYHGKLNKVYGPFKKEKSLLKVLAKIPNTFYHIGHIVIDTSLYSKSYAENLSTKIINKIQAGETSFEKMASTYSADNFSAPKGGDLGWFIRGIMLPKLDEAMLTRKKGEIFTVWTEVGLHIVKILDEPKKDNGFALLLRVKL